MDVNIFHEEHKDKLAKLEKLPASCSESADILQARRADFEKNGVFPAGVIDNTVKKLKSYNDHKLSEKLYGNNEAIRELVMKYIHCK
jgi:glutamine synthetase